MSQILQWLQRISTYDITQCDLLEKDENTGLILCHKFASVAERHFSVCSNTPTLYQNVDLNSVLAMQVALHGCIREARRGLSGQRKAFLVQDQVLQMLQIASASNWIKHAGRGQSFQKCWLLGSYCQSPRLLYLWRLGAEAKQKWLVSQVFLFEENKQNSWSSCLKRKTESA